MHRKKRGLRVAVARNEEGFGDEDEEKARDENDREPRAAMKFYIKERDWIWIWNSKSQLILRFENCTGSE